MTAVSDDPRRHAAAARAAGDHALAFRIVDAAARERVSDAAMWNSAGDAAIRAGLLDDGAERFARAVELEPQVLEYSLNHAIALGRCGRDGASLERFRACEDAGRGDVRYCSARAARSFAAGDRHAAAHWYDAALAIRADHARALSGRARVALERAEDTAMARYERAIEANPSDPALWLGKAQALDAAGRLAEAADLAQALVAQAPHWLDALRFRAALLVGTGDADFARPFRLAEAAVPADPNIPAAHCGVLAGQGRFTEAAEVAAAARARFPSIEEFAQLEAQHAGEAGDAERAERIWRQLELRSPGRRLHFARHRLRLGDALAAEQLLGEVLAEDPWNVSAWALRAIAWRLLGDPRNDWLNLQDGLVALVPLTDCEALLAAAVPMLHALHDTSIHPLGQSLRGGSQTRGGLFDRHEPAFGQLHEAVVVALERYRGALPPSDPSHPLLRHRDSAWRVAGSWSVRLAGAGDHHTSHVHPGGIISSALYLELPPETAGSDQAGWLELGRPPADLRLDLAPLRTVRPLTGHLALFPSTLYHGTRPFAGGSRLTVAFDVNARVRRS